MTPVMTECDELSLPYDTVLDESPDFSLPQTLLCGQAFRWRQLDQNTFIGAPLKKYVRLHRRRKNCRLLSERGGFWILFLQCHALPVHIA